MKAQPLAALLWQIAVTFGSISLVAIGGANAVIPAIHHQVVEVLGWMSDTTFANLFAIAQAAPGPNVLMVSLIGWHVAGFAGLAVATLAMVVPTSLLALGAGRLVTRLAGVPLIRAAQRGLTPIAVGLILASGAVMAQAADSGLLAYAETGATALFVLTSERSPLWALAVAALVSILAGSTGLIR